MLFVNMDAFSSAQFYCRLAAVLIVWGSQVLFEFCAVGIDFSGKLTAYIHDEVTAQAAQLTGFAYDAANTGNVRTGTITTDGVLVLKLYYIRNSYEAKWYDYDGTTLLGTTQFKYGQAVTAPTFTANRDGYRFIGWWSEPQYSPEDGSLEYDRAMIVGPDSGERILYAQWEKSRNRNSAVNTANSQTPKRAVASCHRPLIG